MVGGGPCQGTDIGRRAYAGDISSRQDALALDHYGAIDCIITNPPYDTAHRRNELRVPVNSSVRRSDSTMNVAR
jgi:hypothetical protein